MMMMMIRANGVVTSVPWGSNLRDGTQTGNSPGLPKLQLLSFPSTTTSAQTQHPMASKGVPLTEEERRSVVQGPGDVEWKYVIYQLASFTFFALL